MPFPVNQHHPVFGGDPNLGSTASRYDAVVTIGGCGKWEISKIIASYYTDKAQLDVVIGYGTHPRGRLCVVRGAFNRMSPASYAATNDPLGSVKPENILLDIPWNPGQTGSVNGTVTVQPVTMLPLVLDFPRDEEIGALIANDGEQLSVILFAGTVSDTAGLVYVGAFVQCLHVCAHRVAP